MNGRDRTGRRKLTKQEVGAINRNVVVFTFFLILSFGLWYINSLSKEMEADIKYPVRYTHIPKERSIGEETPDRLSLSLKGPGYTVLKLKISGNKPPVIIDLSKVSYRRVPDTKNSGYFIVTSGLFKSLTVQLRSGCEIIAIKPDTLFFALNREDAKKISGSR